MFERLKSWFSSTPLNAASQLPPVAPIKARPGFRAWPAFFSSTKPSTSDITRPERRLMNTDVLTYRNRGSTIEQLQLFAVSSPELANAVYTAVRLGVPEKFVAVVRNMDGTINPDGTKFLQGLIARFDVIGDPAEGYTGTGSIKSTSESLARDLVMYGQMSCELVLDKSRLPYRLQPFSSTSVLFKEDRGGFKPYQKIGDTVIDLDLPTVALVQLDNDLLNPYANSPIEAALRAVAFSEMFMTDLTRVVRRATFPRVMVAIDEEKFRKNLSPEAQMDDEMARAEMSALISEIENKINNLSPQDALIYFDTLGIKTETPTGMGSEYETLRDIANAKLASATKSLPSVLGLESGSSSSNIASTEVALYIRSIDSSIRQKLNEIYSRLFTVAVRLAGIDGYAVFEYEPINIRPETELVAFRQTRQMMILEQLSYGFITDEEASLLLTGKLPPAGFRPLSGTHFHKGGSAAEPGSLYGGQSNDGSTLNKNLASDAPAQGRGGNKKVGQ